MKNNLLYNFVIVFMLLTISFNIVVFSGAGSSIDGFEDQIENEVDDEILNNETEGGVTTPEEEKELPNCPSFRSALAAYEYASKILDKQTNLYVASYGSISAAGGLGNQSVKNIKKIDGEGNIYCESVSKKTSMFGVNVAECSLYTGGENILTKTSTTISDSLVASYPAEFTTQALSAYVDENKLLPWERAYDIDENCIVSSNITFNGKEFKCAIILSNKSVERYRRKIQKTSGSSSLPNFSNISVSFSLDKKGRFVSFESEESYTVDLGIKATVSQKLKETYYYKNVVIDEVSK